MNLRLAEHVGALVVEQFHVGPVAEIAQAERGIEHGDRRVAALRITAGVGREDAKERVEFLLGE